MFIIFLFPLSPHHRYPSIEFNLYPVFLPPLLTTIPRWGQGGLLADVARIFALRLFLISPSEIG